MPIGPALPETSLVLDTDVFTHWRNNQPYVLEEIAAYFRRLKSPPAITSMTVFESLSGIESQSVRNRITEEQASQYRSRIEMLSQSCTVLPFDDKAAVMSAYIFPRLRANMRSALWKDLFIAATAIAHGYGVATQNRRDFELIANNLPPNNPLLRLAIWKV